MNAFDLESELKARNRNHLYRHRHVLESQQGPVIYMEGRPWLNFCSNDYLGLAGHPEIIKSFQDAAQTYGVGSGSSHIVVGHNRPHHELEEALAEFTGRPRALLFSTGYMANIGTVNALVGRKDAVFEDRLNHASLLDAGLLSGARFKRYLHCDGNSLDQRLSESFARRKLVVTDGVFSMDGNMSPLSQLAMVTKKHCAWLMVDDAHGFGVLGKTGAGSVEEAKLSINEVPVLMATLGKALGTMGAFVAGSEALIETLIQFARTYVYTTALPPAIAAATLTSLALVKKESWRREKILTLIEIFKRGCASIGLNLMPSDTPIQPIIIGSACNAMIFSKALYTKDILVNAIRPPTVAKNSSRLRVTISATHSEQQVNQLLDALAYANEKVVGMTYKNYGETDVG